MGDEYAERDAPHKAVADTPELRGQKFLVVAIAVPLFFPILATVLLPLPLWLGMAVVELLAPLALFFVVRALGHKGIAERPRCRVKPQAKTTESQHAVPPANMRHVHLIRRTQLIRRMTKNRSGGWTTPSGNPVVGPSGRSNFLLAQGSSRGYYCSSRTPWTFSSRSSSRRSSSGSFFLRRSRRERCGCRCH